MIHLALTFYNKCLALSCCGWNTCYHININYYEPSKVFINSHTQKLKGLWRINWLRGNLKTLIHSRKNSCFLAGVKIATTVCSHKKNPERPSVLPQQNKGLCYPAAVTLPVWTTHLQEQAEYNAEIHLP